MVADIGLSVAITGCTSSAATADSADGSRAAAENEPSTVMIAAGPEPVEGTRMSGEQPPELSVVSGRGLRNPITSNRDAVFSTKSRSNEHDDEFRRVHQPARTDRQFGCARRQSLPTDRMSSRKSLATCAETVARVPLIAVA